MSVALGGYSLELVKLDLKVNSAFIIGPWSGPICITKKMMMMVAVGFLL